MSSPPTAEPGRRRRVAVLGSTGSIGTQALDVLARHADVFEVVALAAGGRSADLAEQAARFRPAAVALAADEPIDLPAGTHRVTGEGTGPLIELASRDDVDLVVVATGGIVSLRPVLAALEAGKVVATANKETLVAGGHLVMPLARARAAERAAVDAADPFASPSRGCVPSIPSTRRSGSASSANPVARVASLVLTASGGPFLDGPADLPRSRRTRRSATRPGRWGRRSRSTPRPSPTRAWSRRGTLAVRCRR
jgi:1-deoxy-D-xylulose-5-phosphate reductoisomerase